MCVRASREMGEQQDGTGLAQHSTAREQEMCYQMRNRCKDVGSSVTNSSITVLL